MTILPRLQLQVPACALLVMSGIATAHGQVVLGPQGPVNPEWKHRQPPAPSASRLHEFRLVVSPAAEPDPALRYALFPRVIELEPGNSVPMWYRSLMLAEEDGLLDSAVSAWNRYVEGDPANMPLGDDELKTLIVRLEGCLSAAREAAFRRNADWDLRVNELRGAETIQFRLAEFQVARDLARLLVLRARYHWLSGRFDDALLDLQVTMRLAHDIAASELIITNLVGMGIHAIALGEVMQFLSAPDAPNLYWALAHLPDPFFDLRSAAEGEMTLPERYFPWLADPASAELTAHQWHGVFRDTVRELGRLDESLNLHFDAPDHQVDLVLLGLVLRAYPAAQRDLIEAGHLPDDLARRPLGQVVAMHEWLVYRRAAQSSFADLLLPLDIGIARSERTAEKLQENGYLKPLWQSRCTFAIANSLLPAHRQFAKAAVRRETTRRALMVVEAIRMHLATTGGDFPRTLNEIAAVPVPKHPLTGEAFAYEREGETAVLHVSYGTYGWRIELQARRDTTD